MLELFLALSTAQICVAALCVGLSALAWAHSLLLLVSLGASGLRVIYFGISPSRADLEKVCLSQSSLQGKCFRPRAVLGLSPLTVDTLCMTTHPCTAGPGSTNPALAVCFAVF